MFKKKDYPFEGMSMNFLGDSITATGKYQKHVKRKLKLREVRNYGASGTTLSSNGKDGLLDRYKNMRQADIIFVLGGTNDFGKLVTLEKFEKDARLLINGLKEKYSNKLILFGTLPPRFHLNQVPTNNINKIGLHPRDISDTTKKVCKENNIPVVDIFEESGINESNHEIYLADRIHPTKKGYRIIANLIVSHLYQLHFKNHITTDVYNPSS
ncbi:SGNH/GDSL hydrolase family protein [Paraliobacillus ryukyuensis]|uniref:SGNH/GDSL hydrolase family protein n=1 Tax=Paraliobacillus ryukyuensis TaxID=200904 RepID=UPI0009A6437F|nr:SGNH/GDSL hydrolase family protein [Paraliobacillus ryukyuensis]